MNPASWLPVSPGVAADPSPSPSIPPSVNLSHAHPFLSLSGEDGRNPAVNVCPNAERVRSTGVRAVDIIQPVQKDRPNVLSGYLLFTKSFKRAV